MQYLYVTNQSELDASLSLLDGDSLACDTETYALPKYGAKGSALDPHTGRISLLICKSKTQQSVIYDIIWLEHVGADLSTLFNILQAKDYLLFHHGKFDLKMFQSTFGWMPENVRDTMVMAKLITNATGSKAGQLQGHGYADLCRDYLDIHITGKGEEQTSTWYCGVNSRNLDNDWWKSKLDYAANDVQYLFQLEDIMLPVLFNPLPDSPLTKSGNTTEEWGLDMREVFDREMQYIPLLAEREYRGMPVSKPMFKALQEAAQTELNEVACRLSRAFDLDLPKEGYFGEEAAPTALKALRSSTQLKSCIQKALKMGNLDNVQAAVIRRIVEILDALSVEVDEENKGGSDVFIDENEELAYHELKEIESSELLKICPIMKDVLTFKRLSKQVSMDLSKYVNPVTGRIHCLVNQLGTATGRCIAAGQTVAVYPNKNVAIEDIKVGDLVYCFTEEGQLTYRPVLNTFSNGFKPVVKVKWRDYGSNGSLICTADHLLGTLKNGWVKAIDAVGNEIMGCYITSVQPYGIAKVFDIEVEELHNYIVEELPVHNCSTNAPNLQQVSARTTIQIELKDKDLFRCTSK